MGDYSPKEGDSCAYRLLWMLGVVAAAAVAAVSARLAVKRAKR